MNLLAHWHSICASETSSHILQFSAAATATQHIWLDSFPDKAVTRYTRPRAYVNIFVFRLTGTPMFVFDSSHPIELSMGETIRRYDMS